MKSVLEYAIGALILMVMSYGIWIYFNPAPVDTLIDAKLENTTFNFNSVTVQVEKHVEESESEHIEYFVPKVLGAMSPLATARINTYLKEQVGTLVDQFKEEQVSIVPDQKDTLSLSMGTTTVTHRRYLNIEISEYSYLSGAAHPLTHTYTYVFDLWTGERINLPTLFNQQLNYLEDISRIVKEKLGTQLSLLSVEQNQDVFNITVASTTPEYILEHIDTEAILEAVFFEEGVLPKEENFNEFLILPEGIQFYFGQYQVAPYVYGEQRILIPYSELLSVLSQTFRETLVLE